MKKTLFIFFIIFLSWVTIAWTIKTYKANVAEANKKEMKQFLESGPWIYSYDPKTKDFPSKAIKSKYSYHRFSPIDWVYYTSTQVKKPIVIKETWNKTIISITEWEYVFELNDIFEKYEIQAADFNINQLGKWVFYVNNIKWDYKIYSFNSLLRLDLISKPTSKVTFDLFPSLLFKYNPEYNKNLLSIEFDPKTKKNTEKSADVLRISQINPIRYVDSKDKKFYSQIISDSNGDNLIKIAVADIKLKFEKYWLLFGTLIEMDIEDIPWMSLSKDYSAFFQNKTKKAIYLKNSIAKNFVSFLKNSWNKEKAVEIDLNIQNIENSLLEMQEVSDSLYKEWADIIKNYYYISYFGNILGNVEKFDFTQGWIGAWMKKIFKDKIAWEDYFWELSDLFFTYQFSDANKDIINAGIDVYLGWLIENKILKDSDFLNFSFFLTQYALSEENISRSSINIVKYLIEMYHSYYLSVRDTDKSKENEKKFSTLSVQFYSLTKIINKINNSVISNFFERRPDKSVQLKAEYVQDSWGYVWVSISKDILLWLASLHAQWTKDMQNKKNDYLKLLNIYKAENASTKNNYVLLNEQYAKLDHINEEVLGNYNAWVKKLNLKKEFRDAKEIIYEEAVVMNKDELSSYISQFNWVEISSLNLINESSLLKDWYYKASVNVINSNIEFRLYPEGHKLSNIIIVDLTTQKKTNYPTSIILDDKEELFDTLVSSAENEASKRKYDFKNFLANILNLWVEVTQTPNKQDDTDSKPTEARFISLFKQNKLIDWDFTFIKKFINIPFSSINVKIINEEYVIDILNADKSFNWESLTFGTKLNSSYNFASKTFENITFLLLKENRVAEDPYELWGNEVSIVPSRIWLKEFSQKLSDLGKYIEILKANYVPWAINMKVDLNSSKVYIDSKSFPVN
ncbi:MAG: hypothetical protein ACD_3C00026G0006 [uncultured bacterium (gcode 4)]|uniref:Uncharacterized protein n=1 Tax=uncultured bacterium (gcode 4) TaxID=1234023 RepID=K2GZ22_9BACT|nr:MAG: hypothetical protein ACD_3C00026G0006 [uncultured bacterium (gcode 4)]